MSDTALINFGCGILSISPIVAGHFILSSQVRYILLSWFCSFVSTVFLIICSMTALFTKNSWIILLFSIPFDTLGKVILQRYAIKKPFLQSPKSKATIGFACGIGYSLSHVLTLYVPILFDQPYSMDFDSNHPPLFPNSLDLSISHHSMCLFQIGVCLFLMRYPHSSFLVDWIISFVFQFCYSSLSIISIIPLKLTLMVVIGYGLAIFMMKEFKTMPYQPPAQETQSIRTEE